nr:alpha-amylase family protein [Corynebacterium halotolerans]
MLDHAIWWHVYPLGAAGAPVRDWRDRPDAHGHRLGRLTPWLDYVVELGCDGLLLGPIFDSATHGYDTLDHFRIDPRLGDDADFDRLIAEAHSRGLSVILDGVFNHLGVGHPLVERTREAGAGPVRLDGDGRPRPWEGHGDLAELDHSDPAVADLVVEVMEHWLGRGIAGWRLDVAYAVPVEFWAEVTGRVRRNFPDAVFLGEIIHGDYLALIEEGGLDTVTQYELWKAIWSSIRDVNFWELAHALQRHDEFSARALMQTFVGNHDVDRIASRVGDAGAALAATILFTLPGLPSIYSGDEQAFRGTKGQGAAADDPLRPALPDTPDQLSTVGQWMYNLHRELIGLRRRHPWLARARVEITDTSNPELTYAVTGDGHRLDVRLTLEPEVTAELRFDDGETFRRSW